MNLRKIVKKHGFKRDGKDETTYFKVLGDEEYYIHVYSSNNFYIYVRDFVSYEWVELGFLNSNLEKLIKFLDLLED